MERCYYLIFQKAWAGGPTAESSFVLWEDSNSHVRMFADSQFNLYHESYVWSRLQVHNLWLTVATFFVSLFYISTYSSVSNSFVTWLLVQLCFWVIVLYQLYNKRVDEIEVSGLWSHISVLFSLSVG